MMVPKCYRLPDETISKMESLAAMNETTPSAVLRAALEVFFERADADADFASAYFVDGDDEVITRQNTRAGKNSTKSSEADAGRNFGGSVREAASCFAERAVPSRESGGTTR